ncbi:MAG TPA: alpha/beta fold hydrolase [Polyangiaceae bacterium]|nr:alpha/beta fold hydrolase [Polyangiaceae bacterium]
MGAERPARGARRRLQRAGYALAALIVLERLSHWSLALGIALAPNALGARHAGPSELPPELAARGARRVETSVGPPSATLASWWLEPRAAPARGTILLLHGVRMDRSSLISAGIAFHQAGYRSILVDLRGQGESSGRYLTYGALEAPDLSELLDSFSTRGVPLGNVGVFGFSYGAAVALDLGARDQRVCAVVAAAPFASLREVVVDYRHKYLPAAFNLIPQRWFDAAIDDAAWLAAFNPDQSSPSLAVSRSRAHQLLLHGTSDTQVPLRHSVALSSLAGRRAELRTIAGAEHYDLPRGAQVEDEALRWFERWLASDRCRD